jgi:plastocyanin
VIALVAATAVGACSKKSTNPPPPNTGSDPNLFNSGDLTGGGAGTFSKTFTGSPEIVPYLCQRHTNMRGWVMVMSGGPANASVSIASSLDNGFDPDTVHIGVNGTVTWTNNDGPTHTATSIPVPAAPQP